MASKLLVSALTAAALSGTPYGFAMAESGKTVATVNGTAISTLERETQAAQFKARGQNATDEQVVDELVSLTLMSQEAEKMGLDKTPEMEAEMKIMRARVLANALLTQYTEKLDLSDDTLRAEYDKQVQTTAAKEYKASHILLEDEAKALEIIGELDDGADFAETAKKYSTGPSGPNGGDLGWFDAGAMVPEFSKAVAAMETGKYSATPVKTDFGWHVIKLDDERAKNPQPFESVRDQIRNMMLRNKVAEYIDGLHAAATVERVTAE
jgi:peptidyl-prolyl cis-trans isomerase C